MKNPRIRDLTNQSFGRWTVEGPAENSRPFKWTVRCQCGSKSEITGDNLTLGKSKSCGCLSVEMLKARATHGHSRRGVRSRTFNVWRAMLQRCKNQNCAAYKDYGGRGIKVCEEWLDFSNFLHDMGEAPGNLQIDRQDNDLGYFKGNCRWVTPQQNSMNRRSNRKYEFQGSLLTITEVSVLTGILVGTLESRIRYGWTLEAAFSTSVRSR